MPDCGRSDDDYYFFNYRYLKLLRKLGVVAVKTDIVLPPGLKAFSCGGQIGVASASFRKEIPWAQIYGHLFSSEYILLY